MKLLYFFLNFLIVLFLLMNKDDLNSDLEESNNYFEEEHDETEREAIELLRSQHEQIKNLKR